MRAVEAVHPAKPMRSSRASVLDSRSEPIAPDWDERVLAAHASPHFMQSSTWESVRSGGPWTVSRRVLDLDAGFPVLAFERHVEGLGVLAHLPRVSGIAPDDVPAITDGVRAGRGDAFATKVEFHQPRDERLVAAFLANGWMPTRASQYRYTVVVDTALGDEAVLAAMKKRARGEIRVAERNGVECGRVEPDRENRATMIDLVRETGDRSGAFFRASDYLERVWTAFDADDRGRLYFAWHDGQVVAGAFIVVYGRNAWYKDGASRRDQPQLMASRLLQWAVMCELARLGVDRYELGHVPPPEEPEAPGRGLLTFKSAFAPDVLEYMPAFQLAHEPRAEQWRLGERDFIAAHRDATGDYWY